jgi:hypothetical protein
MLHLTSEPCADQAADDIICDGIKNVLLVQSLYSSDRYCSTVRLLRRTLLRNAIDAGLTTAVLLVDTKKDKVARVTSGNKGLLVRIILRGEAGLVARIVDDDIIHLISHCRRFILGERGFCFTSHMHAKQWLSLESDSAAGDVLVLALSAATAGDTSGLKDIHQTFLLGCDDVRDLLYLLEARNVKILDKELV